MKILLSLLLFTLNAQAKFASEDEVALLSTSGNTDVKTYDVKSKNSYEWGKNLLSSKGVYTYGETDGKSSAEQWNISLRYDRSYSEKMAVFIAEQIEANRFAGYARRYNSDLGLKRTLVKSDKSTGTAELGLRYVVEEKLARNLKNDEKSNARAFVEYARKLKDDLEIKVFIEYIQSFEQSEDYLVNAEPSLNVHFSKMFSLKMAYLINYDNDPVKGNKKQDTKYTTALLATF